MLLPTKPIHFIGGALLLFAVLLFLGGSLYPGLIVTVLGLGLVFSKLWLKDGGKGGQDAP